MFRNMRRIKQQIPRSECVRILREEPRGVLSLIGDGGYPYGFPMDHFYSEKDGCLYFHCAKQGHKLDAIGRCDKASYCVMDAGYRREGEWALNINSVIVFGRMEILTDPAEGMEACRQIGEKFMPDKASVQKELEESFHRVCILRLTPEHITGKLVKES